MNRQYALSVIKNLTDIQKEAIALVIETAETQGDYCGSDADGGSVWTDSVNETLYCLSTEIRKLKL